MPLRFAVDLLISRGRLRLENISTSEWNKAKSNSVGWIHLNETAWRDGSTPLNKTRHAKCCRAAFFGQWGMWDGRFRIKFDGLKELFCSAGLPPSDAFFVWTCSQLARAGRVAVKQRPHYRFNGHLPGGKTCEQPSRMNVWFLCSCGLQIHLWWLKKKTKKKLCFDWKINCFAVKQNKTLCHLLTVRHKIHISPMWSFWSSQISRHLFISVSVHFTYAGKMPCGASLEAQLMG